MISLVVCAAQDENIQKSFGAIACRHIYHIVWLSCALAIDAVTGGVTVLLLIADAETDVVTDFAPQVVMVSGGCALVEGWVGLHHFHAVLHFPCVGNAVCIFLFYQYPFWFFVSVYVVLLFNFFNRVLSIIQLVKLLNLFVRLMIWLANQLMRDFFLMVVSAQHRV
jgi:hypothetical protein